MSKPANNRCDITVDFGTEFDDARVDADWIAGACLLTLASESAIGSIAVRVVNETEGRGLNAEYRHRDRATNVLSFPDDLTLPDGSRWLGDLAICAPVVGREATAQGKSLSAHVAHLIVHGTLHLLGYDHQVDAEAQVMEAKERAILAHLNIEDPYREPR